ncbi:MAG: SDR family oxidoreductase [Chloroflexi bacterium]|nr:SDR family oxidoreductase [Chloroflexota bacterium]
MKTALITGASRGLGLALATALANDGWRLVLDGRDEATLAAARRALEARTEVAAIPGDVANEAHRKQLVSAAGDRLDLLVNNASTLGPSPLPVLAGYPTEALEGVCQVNVLSPLRLIQLSLPILRQSRGIIINVTSDAAVEGYPGWGGYGSSKAALEQLSNVLAAEEPELAVYWVDPGDMRTDMQQLAFPGQDISDRPLPEVSVPGLLELVRARPASGRYRARDVAAAAREA